MNGAFIERNAGVGSDFFTCSARVEQAFALSGAVEVEAAVEAFNLTNRRNVITRNTNFGPGAYPANPVARIRTGHGGRRSDGRVQFALRWLRF